MADKIGVSERSLIQRINRKLPPNQVLKSSRRSDRATKEFGPFYLLDTKQKGVVQRHVDLTQLAKRLDAIEPWEELIK